MTPQKILVTGADGQVGRALCSQLNERAIPLTRRILDLNNIENISRILDHYEPDIIINAAAYTAVDKAESEENLAHRINADAVQEIARYAFQRHIPLIHYSTDYVFNGKGKKPWKEEDIPAPLNAYGRSKLAGEIAIQEEAQRYQGRYLIFRLSWVYDATGRNFMNTMLHLGKEKEVLSVVSDQFGAPSYAVDIANSTINALSKLLNNHTIKSGVYHLVNSNVTSWFGFAEEIFRQTLALGEPLEIKEVKTQRTLDYPTPAMRPLNSRMDCSKLASTFGITMPDWHDALSRCLQTKFSSHMPRNQSSCSG